MQLRLKVRREKDGKVWYDSFVVPYEEGMTFLSALQRIKETQDETLTLRHFCRAGICGTCTIYINGFPKLACKEQVLPYALDGEEVLIEPLKNFRVIRDLVVDHEVIPKRIKELSLWVKDEEKDTRIDPELSRMIENSADCILCGACQSYCPQVLEKGYAGPLLFAKFYRLSIDPRDPQRDQRLAQALSGNLFHCLSCNKCNNVCPKEVEPATLIRRLMLANVEGP
ncbi:succinate dehydrogenase/fumarate reductase iron-sulfur subunit [Thermocrinis sp.]